MRIVQVDAFTNKPFAGNPAAVCVTPEPRDESWMRAVAREMNLSETAFLVPNGDGFNLRWFTPAIEVALCGHATLASAHVLWQDGTFGPRRSRPLSHQEWFADRLQKDGWIEMDFPATVSVPAEAPTGLIEALGLTPLNITKNKFDYLVEVDSEATLRALQPDHSTLRKLPVRGIIVTARGSDYDFVSRFFAPGSGIDEDPVTGSAHCALGPYWASKLGKTTFRAFQASPRGGEVGVRLEGDRAILSGQAVTVLQGELL